MFLIEQPMLATAQGDLSCPHYPVAVSSRWPLASLPSPPRHALSSPRPPATAAPAAAGPFVLPPLTYPTNAFEPHIDARTMEIHHGRHHAAYVANLNNVAKANPQLGTRAITDVLGNINALNDDIKFAVRNNLGGHANHTMFWEIMAPLNGGKPEGEVLAAIDKDLGGLEKFQNDFNAAGGRQFGSGWVFVHCHQGGQARDRDPPEPGQSDHGRQARLDGQRRLGARLLSQLPEPPRRLPEGVVEHGELEKDRRALRRGEGRHAGV